MSFVNTTDPSFLMNYMERDSYAFPNKDHCTKSRKAEKEMGSNIFFKEKYESDQKNIIRLIFEAKIQLLLAKLYECNLSQLSNNDIGFLASIYMGRELIFDKYRKIINEARQQLQGDINQQLSQLIDRFVQQASDKN